jgi:hypothetical protein
LFSRGGLAILDAIEARGFDVLSGRPSLSRWTKVRLLARAVAARGMASILRTVSQRATRGDPGCRQSYSDAVEPIPRRAAAVPARGEEPG